MKDFNIAIERLNRFLENHVFEIFTISNDEPEPVNVRVKLTGIKEYIFMGESKPAIQYTIYILPTSEISDRLYGLRADYLGRDIEINTRSSEYQDIRWVIDKKLENFLLYFSIDARVVCTRIVNEVKRPIKEGLITESKVDVITRKIVKDIIELFKFQRNGEFELPGDLRGDDEPSYFYSNLPEFTVDVNISESDDVEDFDVECGYYRDEDIIEVNIVSKLGVKFTTLHGLIGELNEQIRHELEHMIQYYGGYKMPKNEPTNPYKYYTQPHELGAQVAGFRRKSKLTKSDFEKNVRNWFKINEFKHRLTPKESEKIIEKILKKYGKIN